jgi:transposase
LTSFFPKEYKLESIALNFGKVVIQLISKKALAPCPVCNMLSNSIHSSYLRNITDLPILGPTAVIEMQVRKFFCGNSNCERKIFCERITDITSPYGRKTDRCKEFSSRIAFSTSCEAASKICKYIGIPLSPDTLLKMLRLAEHIPVKSEYI